MITLEQALRTGRGTERRFNCPSPTHDDKNASADVNKIKGVWYCHSCHASGRIDQITDIDPHDLLAQITELLSTEEIRSYPESWLTLYLGSSEYWQSRFTQAAIDHFQLGYDPSKDKPCYPLRSPSGEIHGLVHRSTDPTMKMKYRYPFGSTIGNYLFNYIPAARSTVFLVEGAADAIACWEAGIEAFAILGSRPSNEQARLVRRVEPSRVVLAFDMDTAGSLAAENAAALFGGDYELIRATWDENEGKDPAELSVEQRNSYIGNLAL